MPPRRAGASSAASSTAADESFDVRELSSSSDWRQLSDGGYSEVYKAQLLGLTVAVKQATSRKKTSGEALLREIRYIRLAGAHPNIVTPYGAFEEGGRLHLVLEYARHCLRTDRVARQIDPILVLAGVARALVRLHGLGIVHRDLKVNIARAPAQAAGRARGGARPKCLRFCARQRRAVLLMFSIPSSCFGVPQARNVLVAADNRALLIDFGLACHITQVRVRPPALAGALILFTLQERTRAGGPPQPLALGLRHTPRSPAMAGTRDGSVRLLPPPPHTYSAANCCSRQAHSARHCHTTFT